MADEVSAEVRQSETYLGARLEVAAGRLTPFLEYGIGANAYRQSGYNQRRTNSDILMDYVVTDPQKALVFVQRAIMCGIVMNVMVYVTEYIVRAVSYPSHVTINTYVAWWIVVNKVLQLMQMPLRLLFVFLLKRLDGRSNQEIMYCMAVLTTCRMWFWSKCLTLANYVWYGIGFAFISRLDQKSEEWLNAMTIYVFCVVVFRILFTFYLIYLAFPPSGNRSLTKTPTSRISRNLPLCMYKDAEDLKSTICGICLDDFQLEDILSIPKCNHGFHSVCLDAWLTRRDCCPLCMATVS